MRWRGRFWLSRHAGDGRELIQAPNPRRIPDASVNRVGLMLAVLGGLAEFERDLIRSRTTMPKAILTTA